MVLSKSRFRRCYLSGTHKTTSLPCEKCPHINDCFSEEDQKARILMIRKEKNDGNNT